MKAKRPHRAPLTDETLAILAEVEPLAAGLDSCIFASRYGSPLSDMALSMLVRGMCFDGREKSDPAH